MAEEVKYVVLHARAGQWVQGDVVPEAQIGDALARFLSTEPPAIRRATYEEGKCLRVTVSASQRNRSTEEILSAQGEEIKQLRGQLAVLQQNLSTETGKNSTQAKQLEEQWLEIEGLREQNLDLEKRLQDHEKAT